MYIPRHWHFALSTLVSLLGFYIKHKLGDTYDVVIVFLALQYHAIMHTLYIFKAGAMYQNYITQTPPKDETIYNHHTGAIVDPTPPAADGFIPLARKAVTVPVLVKQQVVSAVRFDMERQFAKDLLVMRDFKPNDEAVDLTEKKWIRPNKFETRKAYTDTLEKWKRYNILGRESAAKNARHVVIDWRQVELIADGNPLPPMR